MPPVDRPWAKEFKLDELPKLAREHWELHLGRVKMDTPALRGEVDSYLFSNINLPALKHPAFIHDWLEKPETRPEVESIK